MELFIVLFLYSEFTDSLGDCLIRKYKKAQTGQPAQIAEWRNVRQQTAGREESDGRRARLVTAICFTQAKQRRSYLWWLITDAATSLELAGHSGHAESGTDRTHALLILSGIVGFVVVSITASAMMMCCLCQQTHRQPLRAYCEPFTGEQIAGHEANREGQLEEHGQQRQPMHDHCRYTIIVLHWVMLCALHSCYDQP
jgi:hypothetical protein